MHEKIKELEIRERQAREALMDAEDRLNDILESTADGFISLDNEFKILYFNHAAEQLLNLSKEDVLGKILCDVFPDIIGSDFEKKYLEALEKDKELNFEIYLHGEFYQGWYEIKVYPRQKGISIFFRSINDRKEEETEIKERVKESENYYRAIFENTGTATIIIEEDKTISRVNGEFEKLYGTDKEFIEGKIEWTFFVHPHDVDQMVEYHCQRSIDPQSVPRNYEFRFIDHLGTEKEIFTTISTIPGTKQRVVSLLDITEDKYSKTLLEWESQVNQSLAQVYAPLISADSTLDEIASIILYQAIKLTGSEVGFVGEILPQSKEMVLLSMIPPVPDFVPHTQALIKLEDCGIYKGLMGYSLNQKKGFFTNNAQEHPSYKETPHFHIPIDKFLSVPVLLENEVVGQISLSAPQKTYTEQHLDAVNRLANFYALAIQRMRVEEKVVNSLQEKKVLLREIHHRVKNNLQIISSLLNLQSRFIEDPEARDVFKESQGRVRSMAFIHEKLYRSDSLEKIEFYSYVKKLVESLIQTYIPGTGKIAPRIEIENVFLNIETAIPCGLIINELVSNSLKHAFNEDETGEITVKMKKESETYQIEIADNGKGFPSKLDFKNTDSLGLQLVNSLIKQLDGKVELKCEHGTCFEIRFHEIDYKKRI